MRVLNRYVVILLFCFSVALYLPFTSQAFDHPVSVSEQAVAFIKRVEAFSPRVYRDADGNYAIGYGMHKWKGRKVTRTYPRGVSEVAASEELVRQLEVYERIVRTTVNADLTQPGFDALVSIAFNLGRVNTRILDKVNRQEPVTVEDFLATATVRGRRHDVLVQRRLCEYIMFLGDYDYALRGFKTKAERRQMYSLLRSLPVRLPKLDQERQVTTKKVLDNLLALQYTY